MKYVRISHTRKTSILRVSVSWEETQFKNGFRYESEPYIQERFGQLDSGFCCTRMSDHNPHGDTHKRDRVCERSGGPEVTLNFILLMLKSPFWRALQFHSRKISFETTDPFNFSKQMAAHFSPRFELQLQYSSIDLSIPSSGRALLYWNRQQPGGRQWRADRQLDGFLTSQPLLRVQRKKGLTRLAGKGTKHVEEKT